MARITWEDAPRGTLDVFYECTTELPFPLSPDPNAFLLAGLIPAFRHGERRVLVDGRICPRLRDGLIAVMKALRGFYGLDRRLPFIEATGGFEPVVPAEPRSTATLCSGGVDSLFSLRKNRRDFPSGHPYSVRHGILVFGHDYVLNQTSPWSAEFLRDVRAAMDRVTEDAGVHLIPMAFNLRELDDDLDFYTQEFCGPALAGAAHTLAKGIGTLLAPSSYEMGRLVPCSNHPLLDPNLSSSSLSLVHDGAAFSRLEKLRLVSEWPVGLANLRVCGQGPPPATRLNCGFCEKCLRTRVGLLILGRLHEATSFPPGDVTVAELERLPWTKGIESFWPELLEGVRAIGRDDLARPIDEKLAAARRYTAWLQETDWRGSVKRLDRQFLGGALRRFYRTARGR
ncbi:MAG TPA: hypothetical protein VG777_05315 [Thermoanaerobaculia bacterium]|nr:hypothetical protein [Thermoanaerobaculia bacterium]